MRLEIVTSCSCSPIMLATITQVRQAPKVSMLHACLMFAHIIQRDRNLRSAGASNGAIHRPGKPAIVSLAHQRIPTGHFLPLHFR